MARERLSVRKIREVLRLRFESGLSLRQIGRGAGVGYGTVCDYLGRFHAAGLSWPITPELEADGALEALLFRGYRSPARSRPIPDWPHVHEEMQRKNVTIALVWEEYRRENPSGFGYSRFTDLYGAWRRTLDPCMRQMHRPGERVFLDFSGATIPIVDRTTGEIAQAKLFVAVLGHSNFTYVEPVLSEDLGTWIGANARALEFFGGVPEIGVPDNLKAGVSRACRYEPEVNPTYAEFAEHYAMAIVPARAGKPRDKAKVEVGVQIAQRWILAALRNETFYSLDELWSAVRPLLDRLNDRVMRKVGRSRRDLFEKEERGALKALPATRFEMAEWKRARVNIDYHAEFERHYYSVPYSYLGAEVEIRATASVIEIFKGTRRIASHPRSRERNRATTVIEHMPKSHREYSEWSPSRLCAWAKKMGPSSAAVVEEIMKRRMHPVQGFRSCLGILRLSKQFGAERLERACTRAVAYNAYSYKSIETILKQGLDARPTRPEKIAVQIPLHENIRGSGYYN